MTTTKHTEEIEFVAKGARQTERDLDSVGESYNSLGMAALAAAKRVGISEDQIKKATKAFAAMSSGIGAATAAWAALQKTIEIGTAGAKISDLEAATRRLGTTSGDIQQLQHTLAGTVSSADILRFNNMARTLGLTQEQFAKAAEVSKAAAGTLGIDVRYALESVSVGLARQSKLWLDNLGIIIDVEKANREYAASLGTTAAKLDDAQKRQAFFNAFVESGDRLIAKAGPRQADVFERWAADFDNLGDAATKLFAAIAAKGLTAIDDLTGRTQELADAADPAAAKLRAAGEAATEAGENLRRAQLALKAAGSVTRAEAQAILDAAEADFKKAQQGLLAASKAVVDEQVSYAKRFKDGWVSAFEGVQSAIQKIVKKFQDAEDRLPGFIEKFGRGVADPEEAKRQAEARARAAAAARARRARLAETGEFFQGDGLREAVAPLLESDPEERIYQATREAPGEVAAAGGVPESLERDREKARADFLASQRAQRDSALEVLSAINAQAAAYARLGVSIDGAGKKVLNVSSIMGTVGVDALASIGSALGDAAVQALFYGESFSKALGNALMAAGASAIGFAISGAAIAGVMAFIPGMQAEAAALGIAAAAAAGAGLMLAGIGKAMGGDLNTGGLGGGGAGSAAGRSSPSETAERDLMRDRRRSRNTADQQEVTIIINNSLGGERVDRAIHRAAVRGARFDRPRRAGAM